MNVMERANPTMISSTSLVIITKRIDTPTNIIPWAQVRIYGLPSRYGP